MKPSPGRSQLTEGLLARDRTRTVSWELLTWPCLAAYGAFLAAVVRRHEPWFDEAQSWLLARDLGFWDLLGRELRYEGTPGLWLLLLRLPARMGAPYWALNAVGALAAFSGVVLLVRRSPFPLPIRLILPFTFFLFYQYAVVARSYNLLLLLLGLLALAYPARVSRPYRFIAAAVLLANVSVHALFLACAIVGVSMLRLIVSRRHLSRLQIRRNATALVIFAASAGLVVAQLWPTWDVWEPSLPVRSLRLHLYDVFTILDESFTEIPWLTVLVLGVSLLWFWRRKVLAIFLLGLVPVFFLFESRYYALWHQGIVFLFWLFCLWLSFERSSPDLERPKAIAPLPLLVGLLLFAVAAIQADWSFRTALFDWTHAYSGSRALALSIKDRQLEGRRIFAKGYATFAVQPYFNRNLFANFQDGRMPAAFHWSRRNGIARNQKLIWIGNPDFVVFSLKLPALIPKRMSRDYRLVKIFPGGIYWKNRLADTDAFALFEREPETLEKEGPRLNPP